MKRYDNSRILIKNETVKITKELGNVVFIGAIAIYFHTKSDRTRGTHDIDLAIASPLSEEYLNERGYRKFEEHGKAVTRTPRHFKIDIFDEDVTGIPVSKVIKTARNVSSGKNTIKVACLEVLIIAKHRVRRPQDIQDLQDIAKTMFSKIDWVLLQSLTESDHEFQEIKITMNQYYKM